MRKQMKAQVVTEILCVCVMWESFGEDLRQMCLQKCDCDLNDYLSREVAGQGALMKDVCQCWDIAHWAKQEDTVCELREREEGRRESLPQPVHPVSPLMCAFTKTKSSLASTAPSVISFSNKTKGNGPHFLLELIVPDLYVLKLRGGRARQQTCCCRVPVLV